MTIKKTSVVQLRITPEMKKEWEIASSKLSKSMTDYVTDVVNHYTVSGWIHSLNISDPKNFLQNVKCEKCKHDQNYENLVSRLRSKIMKELGIGKHIAKMVGINCQNLMCEKMIIYDLSVFNNKISIITGPL